MVTLVDTLQDPCPIAVNATSVYWADGYDLTIRRCRSSAAPDASIPSSGFAAYPATGAVNTARAPSDGNIVTVRRTARAGTGDAGRSRAWERTVARMTLSS